MGRNSDSPAAAILSVRPRNFRRDQAKEDGRHQHGDNARDDRGWEKAMPINPQSEGIYPPSIS